MKLVAMADVVPEKLNDSYDKLKTQFAGQVDVPPERRFLGFDAYRKAMDSLKPGDVVILGTPPAFRWVQFTLRHRQGPAHLHGEAGHGGRPDHAADAGSWANWRRRRT